MTSAAARTIFWHLSHTRLEDIVFINEHGFTAGCTYRHQATEYRDVPEPESDESEIGIIMHAGCKGYGDYLIDNKRWSDKDGYRRILTALMDAADLDIDRRWEAEMLGDIFLAGWELKSGDLHLFEPRLAVDRNFEVCSPTLAGDRCAGSMDYFRKKGRKGQLLDYKFGFKKFWDYDAFSDLQLQLYAWLLFNHYEDLDEIDAELWCPRYGINNRAQATFYREQMDELVVPRVLFGFAVLDAEWEAHGNGDWTARPNWEACKWCRLKCPLMEKFWEEMKDDPLPEPRKRGSGTGRSSGRGINFFDMLAGK